MMALRPRLVVLTSISISPIRHAFGAKQHVCKLSAELTLSSNYSMLEVIHADLKQDFIQSHKNEMQLAA